MTDTNLFQLLKQKQYITIAALISIAVFSFNYYLMATLPGEQNLACTIGGSLTPKNLFFSALISIMTGILFAGMFKLFTQKKGQAKGKIASLSGISIVTGSLTIFCTFCTLPVISLFGLSVGIGFITFYETPFQFASIALMLIAIKMLNRQLIGECQVCKIKN